MKKLFTDLSEKCIFENSKLNLSPEKNKSVKNIYLFFSEYSDESRNLLINLDWPNYNFWKVTGEKIFFRVKVEKIPLFKSLCNFLLAIAVIQEELNYFKFLFIIFKRSF